MRWLPLQANLRLLLPADTLHWVVRLGSPKAIKFPMRLAWPTQVQAAALRMVKIEDNVRLESKWWPAGPVGSSGEATGSTARHQAVVDARDYLLQVHATPAL
jgi:hypothetical protein